jgi:hypothetical protein
VELDEGIEIECGCGSSLKDGVGEVVLLTDCPALAVGVSEFGVLPISIFP